jgi:hypothetical protein
MSNRTLAQMAEKPSMVTTDETTSSLADSRQGRPASPLRHPNAIDCSLSPAYARVIVAAGLSDDNDALIS